MNTPGSPCRLSVYLARDAPVAVVLRRGPSAWARLSLWHTDTDEIEHGQWLAGRVYARRCDVSAGGSLFAYFVHKATGATPGTDSWFAISRPPWFTALALWPIGMTYFTGGFFTDESALYIGGVTGAPDQGALPPWLTLAGTAPYIDGSPDWPSRTVYINRLLRGGWTAPDPHAEHATWERREPGGDRTLVMSPVRGASFETYGGRHVLEYALLTGGEMQPLGIATWADWDQRGRLIVAQVGRLLEYGAGGELRVICDFNAQAPDPQQSPAWARAWPEHE